MDRPTGPIDSVDLLFETLDSRPTGVPIDGDHAEQFLLSTVGPTALWLARMAVRETGQLWPIYDVGRALGVKVPVVRHSALRLALYGFGVFHEGGSRLVLQVHHLVEPSSPTNPRLPARLRDRLRAEVGS